MVFLIFQEELKSKALFPSGNRGGEPENGCIFSKPGRYGFYASALSGCLLGGGIYFRILTTNHGNRIESMVTRGREEGRCTENKQMWFDEEK